MQSPGFSNFRSLMDLWDEQLEKQEREKIRSLLEVNGFVFFFKVGNELFAASEDSRLTFARMKNPDEEADKEWGKDAAFKGVSLTSALQGEKKESMFYYKDLKSIKVLDKEDAYKELTKLAQQKGQGKKLKTILTLNGSDDDYEIDIPANYRKLGDDV